MSILHFSAESTGSPLNFIVAPGARNMTERNGVITGYSLSCAPQTGGGSIFMQYTQAGNFTLEEFTPDTPTTAPSLLSTVREMDQWHP